MIRKGLKIYLQVNLGNKFVDETSSCSELMNALKRKTYTHLILDIILGDGSTLEVIPTIRSLYPDLNILIFSMQAPEVYGEALKQYGIFNYLSKSAGEDEILNVLNKFLHNQSDVSPKSRQMEKANPFSSLSPRELEVLHYLLKGIGTKDVSEHLNLRMNTISTLKTRILAKTNSPNMKHLMELAAMYNINC
jgi:two-component system, NarL family, invasion response regulator UvrY